MGGTFSEGAAPAAEVRRRPTVLFALPRFVVVRGEENGAGGAPGRPGGLAVGLPRRVWRAGTAGERYRGRGTGPGSASS